ncbi:hypothetical protein RJ640_000847 [Escallonia rubra]|uniref:RRM domain-containing protein n=1 Tax=Escallonia rubra TaxID=112253 RepID=A0AA88UFD6_9ASTE|nr:hypothetical protein RJ640_000847 [Escallonia rubra]
MGNIFRKQTKNVNETVAEVGQATKPLKREAEEGIENQVAAKKQKKESFGSEEECILNEVGNTGSKKASDHEHRAPSGTETTKAGSEEKDGDAERSEEADEEQPQRIKTKQVPKRRFTVISSDSEDSYSRSDSQYSGYSYSSYDSGSSCTSFHGKESSEEGECYWEDEIKQRSSDENSDETLSEDDDQTYDEDEEHFFKANNDVEMTDAGSAQAQTKRASSMAAAAVAAPLGETLETKAVFVRNLSKDVEQADLEKFFQEAGEIARVYLAATKIFAYVEFTTVEAAQKAIKLRGQKLLDCAVRLRLTTYRLPRDTSDRLFAAVASLAASRRDPLPCVKDSPQG